MRDEGRVGLGGGSVLKERGDEGVWTRSWGTPFSSVRGELLGWGFVVVVVAAVVVVRD